MLTAIVKQTGISVIACYVEKQHGPFICKGCGEETILHKGPKRVHHFKHKKGSGCSVGAGESEEHRQCKMSIYNALVQKGITVHVEYDLKEVRPDLLAWINGQWIAIEVQRSNLNEELLLSRTQHFTNKGIPVIWIVLRQGKKTIVNNQKFTPAPWERVLYELYHQTIYVWSHDDNVIPIVFYPRFKYKDGGDFGSSIKEAMELVKPKLYAPINLLSFTVSMDVSNTYRIFKAPMNFSMLSVPKSNLIDDLPSSYIKHITKLTKPVKYTTLKRR